MSESEPSVGRKIIAGLSDLFSALKEGRMKFQVWYQWGGGLKHLRYEMPWPSAEADEMKADIDRMRQAWAERGDESPYSYKVVPRD